MTEKRIDGKQVAEEVKQDVAARAKQFAASNGRNPSLVAVQVGHSASSEIYTNMQAANAASVGIDYELTVLPEDITDAQMLVEMDKLNSDPAVDGIILQMPLPKHLDTYKMQAAIRQEKDVEGITPASLGHMFYGTSELAPCTPLAAVELINRVCDHDLAGKEVVIIGASEIFGKPCAMLLLKTHGKLPTITICSSATKDLAAHTKNADIVVAAVGILQRRWDRCKKDLSAGLPDFTPLVTADMVKDGVILIDVATSRIPAGFDDEGNPLRKENGKLNLKTVGDADYEGIYPKAAAITPVPGGVGPVTVSMLLRNTLICAETLHG